MTETAFTAWQIGETTVTRIKEMLGPAFRPHELLIGWDPAVLDEHRAWMVPDHYAPATDQLIMSVHSWLIRTSPHTILVDACCGNAKNRPGSPHFHQLDTPYLDRLRCAGVEPEDVDYVLCTHLHVDHVGWNTRLRDGRWVPTFPNARYVFSRDELNAWDPAQNPHLPDEPRQIFADSVLPVIAARQEQLVGMTDELGDSLLIEPAPGHSPGHIILRLIDGEREAVFTGDVMHNPIQVYRPAWNSRMRMDPHKATQTRLRILEHCAERRLASVFRDRGGLAMLQPTVPSTAPLIDHQTKIVIAGREVDILVLANHTVATSLLGMPAISLPIGRSRTGLSVGLELHAPRDSDSRFSISPV